MMEDKAKQAEAKAQAMLNDVYEASKGYCR